MNVLMPLMIFSAILASLILLPGVMLPLWGCWVLGVLWCLMAWDYVIRLNLLKRVGGLAVVGCAVVILIGSLIPREQVDRAPGRASERVVEQVESTWNALYSGDIFKEFSLKELLLDYGRNLSSMDPFRAGQMILFGLLGIALGFSFLFPLDPSEGKRYRRYVLAVLAGGILYGIQMELLQVLSPSREVTFLSMFESGVGVLAGLVVFVPMHMAYSFCSQQRKHEGRFNVLGVGVDAVNMGDCLRKFQEIIEGQSPEVRSQISEGSGLISDRRSPISGSHRESASMTSALGVAGIVEARRNPRLQRILNESVLNTPDGMPLVWLGKLFGYNHIDRVYGPDLLRDVCAYGVDKGWKHYFYGAAPGIVEKLKDELERKHPAIDVAGIYCPPFRPLTEEEEAALIAEVAECKPDVFWVGISTPKQLYFMDDMKDKLDCKIICPVGYAFDVNAGVEQDAPDWVKYSGLQWLHRAIKQPRLWKRYLPDNPRFMVEVFLQVFRLRKYPMFTHERPLKPFKDAEGCIRYPLGITSVSAMTLPGAVERVAGWIEKGMSHYVNVCTADTMVQCFDRPDMAKLVSESGMATTDGMPLMLQGKLRGYDVTRVYGPDLMLELCKYGESRGYRHYFYGSTDDVLEKLKANLLEKFPDLQVAGMYSPPFRPLTEQEEEEVAERINATKPDIVWCGLGTPKQDYWVAEFQPKVNAAAFIAVGAAFNFHAGEVKQAPRWMMKLSLEWLFRLLVEPRRLWRRYLVGNPRFVMLCLRQLWSELRYGRKYSR
ncbi:WecB/TagA/CpsF family glycosyltransferase [Verrucomicrobiota bacterium]